jgi:methylmalonyl-CoA epimerase
VKIKRVDHIAIVLSDLKPLKKLLVEVLGLSQGHEEIYHGDEGDENICFVSVGDTEVEMCSSVAPTGESARLVAERGQHIEHLAFEVDDIEAAIGELKSRGIPLLQEEPLPGARGTDVAVGRRRGSG